MAYKINETHEDDYVFVLGNTKYLKDLSESECQVLHENGDERVTLQLSKNSASVEKVTKA